MSDKNRRDYERLAGDFIKSHEGHSPETYDDIKGIPTVGYGANLESPDMPGIAEKMNIDLDAVKAGRARLGQDTSEKIFQEQKSEKERYFDTIKDKDFPSSDITDNERAALVSLGYNSPKLWGPNLRQKLEDNDDVGVAREILLESNKNKVPGIQKRRLDEARLYAGDNWENVYNTLTSQEKKELRNIILEIKNPHERERVLNEFPFLKHTMRFQKLRKP